MKGKWIILTLVLVSSLLILGGCAFSEEQELFPSPAATARPATAVPVLSPTATALLTVAVPTATPVAVASPAAVVPTATLAVAATETSSAGPNPESARDAALAYVTVHYPDVVSAPGLDWTAQTLTLEEVEGMSARLYTAGDWEVSIAFPLMDPQDIPYRVLITNHATLFSWEGEVSAGGQVTEWAGPTDQSAEWLVYANPDDGFVFCYPPHWTLTQDPGGYEIAGGRAARSIALSQGTLQVKIQYKHPEEMTILGPGGRPAGQVEERGTIVFLGQSLPRHVLTFEGKDKSVFYGGRVAGLEFYIQLDDNPSWGVDYQSIDLLDEVQVEVDRILESFVRLAPPSEPAS